MRKTLKLGFGRRTQENLNLKTNIFSSQVDIKLHTENEAPILLNSGDSYEGDLKIRMWKTTLKYFHFFLQYFCW